MSNPLKAILKKLLQRNSVKKRESQLRKTLRHVTRQEIARDLKKMGIVEGDAVFLHSSMKSLGYVEGGPKAVIGALLDAIGPNGTLLLPTYYLPGGTILATCQMTDYVFDPRIHGTNMGALPTAFLKEPNVYRSVHPTHSVSALGKDAAYFTEKHHLAPSVFGLGSPWERFHLRNGKVLGLGISMGPVTFYHLLEDMMGDAFLEQIWEAETYRLPVIDLAGKRSEVSVRPYRPEFTARRIDHPSREDLRSFMSQFLTQQNTLHLATVASANAWFITAENFLRALQDLAANGITIYTPPEKLTLLSRMRN